MPWLNISNKINKISALHCILMTVMIVGGEVFANIGPLIAVYFCIVFV